MKTSTSLKNTFIIFSLIFIGFLVSHQRVFASGGKFFEYEKIGPVVSASYGFITPVGDFANAGRGGEGYAKLGHSFELEGMYYHNIGYSDHFRVGTGVTFPMYFLPINSSKLNPQLQTAFANDPYSNTGFTSPKNSQWFAWGAGFEVSALYVMEKFSVEGTLKFGLMYVYAPRYRIVGGSYVPEDFSQYFPFEGGSGRSTKTSYYNLGVQVNYFLNEEVSIFGGMAFQSMNPTYKKELLYVEEVDNELKIERKHVEARQPMQFFQFRVGVAVNIPID